MRVDSHSRACAWFARLWLAPLAVFGCGGAPSDPTAESHADALYAAAPVAPGAWPGVVSLENVCTGVLAGERLIVYAAHCGTHFEGVAFGDHVGSDVTWEPLQICRSHPEADRGVEFDVAYCVLSERPALGAAEVRVIGSDDAAQLGPGTPVVRVGFGPDSEWSAFGVKREDAALIREIGSEIVVESQSGACPGDSGGPLFVRPSDLDARLANDWRLIGVLSAGTNPGCGPGVDHYAKVDGAREWLERQSALDLGRPAGDPVQGTSERDGDATAACAFRAPRSRASGDSTLVFGLALAITLKVRGRSPKYRGVFQRFSTIWGFLVLALALAGCGSPATPAAPGGASDSKELKLGSTPWLPFTAEVGQPRVASYLVERALAQAGYRTTSTIVADGALTPALKQGLFDGSAALWESDDRQEYLLYSEPYLENRMLLVGRRGTDVSARSFAELAGKRIAVIEGYAYGAELDAAKGVTLVRVKGSQENLRAVTSGQADYCLLDALVIAYLLEQHPKQVAESLEIGRAPLFKRTLHFALRKDVPNASEIIKRFNAVVEGMVRDGTYNLALQVTWISADVDGDGRRELVRSGDRVGTAPPTNTYQVFQGSVENTEPSGAPGVVSPEDQNRYYVNGRAYNSWAEIPDSLKLQPDANTVGEGHPQVKLIEW